MTSVIAGLDPAIQGLLALSPWLWMPGSSPYGKQFYAAFVSELEAAKAALAAQEKLPLWE